MRVICASGLLVGRSDWEKNKFYNKIAREWELQIPGEMVLGQVDVIIILGEGLMVCVLDLELAKEMLRKENRLSFAT